MIVGGGGQYNRYSRDGGARPDAERNFTDPSSREGDWGPLEEPLPLEDDQPFGLHDVGTWPGLENHQLSTAPKGKRRRLSRRAKVGLVVVCVVLVLSGLGGLVGFSQYSSQAALAHQAVSHLEAGMTDLRGLQSNPLDGTKVDQARSEFVAAQSGLDELNQNLGQIPGIAGAVPHYGSLLSSAQKVMPVAMGVAQAGIIGCDSLSVLIERLHNPVDTKTRGITLDDVNTLKSNLDQIQGIVNTAAQQVQSLNPDDMQVDARLASAVALFRKDLPQLQAGLTQAQTVLAAAPQLLGIGKPTQYLVEVLDSSELRPGGGFVGNYGIATVEGGRLTSLHIQDTYLLDSVPYRGGMFIPHPAAYDWFTLASNWGLRDSNLDADFPTDARNAEHLYRQEGGAAQVQGVIAVTPGFMQNALRITGPISVPEFHETVTADNFVNRIHYHQLGDITGSSFVQDPGSQSSQRKAFTAYLFDHFFTRVQQVASKSASQLAHLLINSVHTKDIQVYVNDSKVEDILQKAHLGSTVEAPSSGDSLFVVDANEGGNKANYFMHFTAHDNVTIDTSGNAVHHLTLRYAWPYSQYALANDYGNVYLYKDYVRVYVPPKSQLQGQTGWIPQGTTQAFGREVFAGLFELNFGQTGSITLTWKVPHAATHDASGWHYTYLVQKQAGITWSLSVQARLPKCGTIVGKAGNLAVKNTSTLVNARPLAYDLTYAVNYSC